MCVSWAWIIAAGFSGCFALRGSSGGGQTTFDPPREIRVSDIALTEGYRIEPVITGLTFPTGVTFDEKGSIFLIESGYSYGEVWTVPRLLRIQPDNRVTTIASGGKNGPWTAVTYLQGFFYVAEGGELEGGRILRISPEGEISVLVGDLPSRGDHHTNGVIAGPDRLLYFSQGTATNSGVVGEDNAKFGWLKRYPEFHDLPCRDVVLTGENYESSNPILEGSEEKVRTGAYVSFGTVTEKLQVIPGKLPCNGAVMRVPSEGGQPELVAWGFRNPFGLAFSPDGRLFATENQYDVRGSRPVFGSGDLMWEVKMGGWYGWPDFHGAAVLYGGERYKPPRRDVPRRLLEIYPGRPPRPAAVFPVHSSSNGFDFSRNPVFGYVGQAFVAQLGDEVPDTGKVMGPVGFKVVRVDVGTGVSEDFAVNRGKTNGPASWLKSGGLERPVAARFDPTGTSLYVVDFGVMMHHGKGAVPLTGTGVLWRITRTNY
jgi:glucose/arabinose dehydrogenase